jgi:histone acetyltransferase
MDQSEEQSKKRKLDELSADNDEDKETPSTGDDSKQQQEDPATNEPDSETPIENKDEAEERSDPQNDETDKVEEEKKENDQVNQHKDDTKGGDNSGEIKKDEVMEESKESDEDKNDSTESSEKKTAEEGDDKIDVEKEYEKPKKVEDTSKKNEGDNPYESLRWIVVKNDGRPESLIKLVALKSLFSKQLPKMPRAYIARLVFDRRHTAIAILSDDPAVKDTDEEVIGSICYRAFPEMRFAEIAFCAVSATHQVKVCRGN